MSQPFFVFACLMTAVFSLLAGGYTPARPESTSFRGWVDNWRGTPLKRLPLGPREQKFAEGFPGEVAHFACGRSVIIMRYTEQATRKLHPAADCFRGSGYEVEQPTVEVDERGEHWGRFRARRGGDVFEVRERIADHAGAEWTDVSSWYWATLLSKTAGPWWAVTRVEKITPDRE